MWRGWTQDGQEKAEQSEHNPLTLGDSVSESMRIRFSVHIPVTNRVGSCARRKKVAGLLPRKSAGDAD